MKIRTAVFVRLLRTQHPFPFQSRILETLTTNEHEWTQIYKAILCHSSFGCLKLRMTPTRRPVIRR